MSRYDFIYGSKVIVQCQAQINVCLLDVDNEYNHYLFLLKKDTSFFTHFCKPRNVVKCYVREPPKEELDKNVLINVGTNIDDKLIVRKRALTWSKTKGKMGHISGSGHGKQQIIFKLPTFCAKDMGVNFSPMEYSVSD